MTLLECEGRPAQAGMLGMRVLRETLKRKRAGPEILETGKKVLKLLVMSGNVRMCGICLTILMLLLIKHFENIALDEGLNLYRDYAGLVADDVKELIKSVLHALNERDFNKIEEIKQNESFLKKDKEIRHLVEEVLTKIHDDNKQEIDNKDQLSNLPSKVFPTDGRKMKDLSTVLVLASGAAVVASSAAASKSKFGSSRPVKDVWDMTKEITGPYSDVTGFEHIQPQGVGRSSLREPGVFFLLIFRND